MCAVQKDETKTELRTKTTSNQDKTLQIILEAVKEGMTVQEARMGMVIAQFEVKLPLMFGAEPQSLMRTWPTPSGAVTVWKDP